MQAVLIEDSEWRDGFGKKLFELQQAGQFCDVIIKTVEDARLLVHSCVLAASSPLLKGVIESALSDASLGTIMLSSDIDVSTWTHMLEFMYTGSASVPDSLVTSLQSGATILKVDTLIDRCNEILPSLIIAKTEVEAVPVEASELYSAIAQIKEDSDEVIEPQDVIKSQVSIEPEAAIESETDLQPKDIIETPSVIEAQDIVQDENEIDEQAVMETSGGMDVHDSIEGREEMETQDYIDDVHDAPQVQQSIVIQTTENESYTSVAASQEVYLRYEPETGQYHEVQNFVTNKFNLTKAVNGEELFRIKNNLIETSLLDKKSKVTTIVAEDSEAPCTVNIENLQVNIENNDPDSYQIVTNNEECVTLSEDPVKRSTVNKLFQKREHHKLIQNATTSGIEFKILGYNSSGKKQFMCLACNKICMNPTDHKKVHSEARPYVCEFEGCERSYKCKTNLTQHVENHHGPEIPQKCAKCGKCFRTKYLLLKHISITCNDERPFVCKSCGKGFKVLRNLKYHEGLHVKDKPVKCDICGKGVATKEHLKVHKTACHDVSNKICSCGKEFVTVKKYKDHYRLYHDVNNRNRCHFCNKNFISKAVLAQHKKTHDKPFACRICKRGFSNEYFCYLHESRKHWEDLKSEFEDDSKFEVVCVICQKVCSSKLMYLKHKATSCSKNKIDQFQCPHCDRSFTLKRHYDNHILTHDQFQIPCPACSIFFPNEKNLQNHLRTHSKKHVCGICQGKFTSVMYLEKHMQLHKASTIVSFKCEDCLVVFDSNNDLNDHIFTKHPEKNRNNSLVYNCESCDLILTSESLLTKHELQKHFDPKNQAFCILCELKFATPRTLLKHEFDLHSLGSVHQCLDCSRTFYRKEDLMKHSLKVHFSVQENFEDAHKEQVASFQPLHTCIICLKYLGNSDLLDEHEQSHMESELVCRLCKKPFVTIATLKEHYHDCSETVCMYCSQEFVTKYHLENHLRFHRMGKIIYKCSVCSLECKHLAELQSHKKVHEQSEGAESVDPLFQVQDNSFTEESMYKTLLSEF